MVGAYASATEFLENPKARPSCLIVDQHMPQMTLELAARLRGEGVDIPILLITAQPSPAIVARAAQLGIKKVLTKPPTERELLSFVEAHN
jgi:FixJ family two-component response regulator